MNWCNEYSSTLEKSGYKRGIANPCLFYSDSDKVSLMVHGDDFVGVGSAAGVQKLNDILKKAYKVKTQIMGMADGEDKELRVLNRIIRLDSNGYKLEADPRHSEHVIRDLGLEGAKGSRLPGSKDDRGKVGGGVEEQSQVDSVQPDNAMRVNSPNGGVIHILNG